MIGPDDRAFGADDVASSSTGEMLRKLRFLTDNILDGLLQVFPRSDGRGLIAGPQTGPTNWLSACGEISTAISRLTVRPFLFLVYGSRFAEWGQR